MKGMSAPMFARTGDVSPFGKLDDNFDGGRIESVIKEEFNKKRAALTNKPEAAVVRDFMRIVALGPEEAARVYGESVLVVRRLIGAMSDDKGTGIK